MRLEVWCKSDKGLRRDSNQDSFLINRDLGLFVVADGMGGHQGGEVASSMAVKTLENFILNNHHLYSNPRDLLAKAYLESCNRIFDTSHNESPELMGMGTTMIALYLVGNNIYLCNVGDSRIYLFRKPYLWQITEDHSLVNEQLRAGLISEDQVKSFIGKNVITRSVGYEQDVIVDIIERPLSSGDSFLLCSDGLSGMVADTGIENLLNKVESASVVDSCISSALAAGGDDNVTVMFVKVT
jgi:protein phosphatase